MFTCVVLKRKSIQLFSPNLRSFTSFKMKSELKIKSCSARLLCQDDKREKRQGDAELILSLTLFWDSFS